MDRKVAGATPPRELSRGAVPPTGKARAKTETSMSALPSRRERAPGRMHAVCPHEGTWAIRYPPNLAPKARSSAPSSPLAPVSSVPNALTSTAAAQGALPPSGSPRARPRERSPQQLLWPFRSSRPMSQLLSLAASPSRLRMTTGLPRTVVLGCLIRGVSSILLPGRQSHRTCKTAS